MGSGYLRAPLGPVLPAVSVGWKSRRPSRAGKARGRLKVPAWCRCGSRPRCRSLRDLPLKLRQSRRRREGGEGREEGRGGRRGQSPGGGAGTARAWGRGRGHPPGAGPFATAAASPGGRSVCSPPFPTAPFPVAAGPPRRGGGGAPGLTPLGPSCDGAAPPRALNPTGKGRGGERAVKGEEEGAAGPSRRGYAPIAKGKIGGSSGAKAGTTLGPGSNRTSPRDGPGPGSALWPCWVARRPGQSGAAALFGAGAEPNSRGRGSAPRPHPAAARGRPCPEQSTRSSLLARRGSSWGRLGVSVPSKDPEARCTGTTTTRVCEHRVARAPLLHTKSQLHSQPWTRTAAHAPVHTNPCARPS